MGLIEGIAAHEAEKIGGEALAGATGGPASAILAFLKDHWKTIAVGLALLVIAVAVISHFAHDRQTRKERDHLQLWQADTVAAVTVQMPPKTKVTADTAIAAIQWLGLERTTLQKALDAQSAALNVAKAQSASDQKGVQNALEGASQRDEGRKATRAAIDDPKRSSGLSEAEWGKL